MSTHEERLSALRKVVEHFDEKAFKSVDLTVDKIVSIERDAHTADTYMMAHKTVRAACDYLAKSVGQGYQPEFLIDLDTGERIEVKLTAFVVPSSIDGVGVLLPRGTAEAVVEFLRDLETTALLDQARTIIDRSLKAKSA